MSHCQPFLSNNSLKGKGHQQDVAQNESTSAFSDPCAILHEMINAPAMAGDEYTRIKKDIFHAFQMIPLPINHGHHSGFVSSLHDHLMCWDPATCAVVEKTCKKVYNINFDEMLLCNPHYIQACSLHYVPAPSILVPAIEHVFNMYGNALDAKTNTPLFSKQAWQKANGTSMVFNCGSVCVVQTRLKVDHMVILITSLVH